MMRFRLSLLLLPLVAACQSVVPPTEPRLWPARQGSDTSADHAKVPPLQIEFAPPVAAPSVQDDVEVPRARLAGAGLGGDGATTDPTLAAAAAPTPVLAAAEQSHSEKDPWEFTIGGIGSNDRRFRNGNGSVQASLGYYLNDAFEIGVRQNVLFFEGTPDSWNGATRIFADLHLPVWGFRPFVGGEVGWVYGDDIQDETMLGLEAGAKFDLREGAFLFLMAEYQWFFDDADEFDENFDDGSFLYTVGLGVRF